MATLLCYEVSDHHRIALWTNQEFSCYFEAFSDRRQPNLFTGFMHRNDRLRVASTGLTQISHRLKELGLVIVLFWKRSLHLMLHRRWIRSNFYNGTSSWISALKSSYLRWQRVIESHFLRGLSSLTWSSDNIDRQMNRRFASCTFSSSWLVASFEDLTEHGEQDVEQILWHRLLLVDRAVVLW